MGCSHSEAILSFQYFQRHAGVNYFTAHGPPPPHPLQAELLPCPPLAHPEQLAPVPGRLRCTVPTQNSHDNNYVVNSYARGTKKVLKKNEFLHLFSKNVLILFSCFLSVLSSSFSEPQWEGKDSHIHPPSDLW